MLKIAIVDDEWESVEDIERCLMRYSEEFGETFHTTHFKSGFDFLDKYSPEFDAVFMDINMPRINGLKTAAQLRKMDSEIEIVFVSAFHKYAISGYEVRALDYCLKPVAYDTFKAKISRVVTACRNRSRQTVVLPLSGGVIRLPVNSIIYVEISNHDIIYHTNKGNLNAYGTMKFTEELLPSNQFYKCSRCYLVNLRSVIKVEGNFVFVVGDKLAISRSRKDTFIEALRLYDTETV